MLLPHIFFCGFELFFDFTRPTGVRFRFQSPHSRIGLDWSIAWIVSQGPITPMGPSRSLEPTFGDVREIWGSIRSAKTCKQARKNATEKAQTRAKSISATKSVPRIHLHQLLVPFFLDQGPRGHSLGLYQLGYPRVAKQRCTIAQGRVSSFSFTTNIFFKTCWESEFVPDLFGT